MDIFQESLCSEEFLLLQHDRSVTCYIQLVHINNAPDLTWILSKKRKEEEGNVHVAQVYFMLPIFSQRRYNHSRQQYL